MVSIWVFGAIILVSAGAATFVGDIRKAILSLWIAGLGAGGLFLSAGAEVVAVIQLVASTLTATAAMFYAITFGEYGKPDPRPMSRRVIAAIAPVLVGAGFAAVLWLGVAGLPLPAATPAAVEQGHDMIAMGRRLVGEHLLSLEILALTLLLTIVGAGVVARSET